MDININDSEKAPKIVKRGPGRPRLKPKLTPKAIQLPKELNIANNTSGPRTNEALEDLRKELQEARDELQNKLNELSERIKGSAIAPVEKIREVDLVEKPKGLTSGIKWLINFIRS